MRWFLATTLLFLAVPAQATPIKIVFSGTVDVAGSALSPTIVVGSPISGFYIYDSNAPNTSANPLDTGDYAVTIFSATIGGFSFSSNSATLFVEKNSGEYEISLIGGAGDTVNGHKLDVFGLGTSSPDITGTSLPLTPPNGNYGFSTGFGLPPAEGSVSGVLSSIAVSTTPLPGTLPLFATGLGALGLLRWRRKSRATDLCR